MFDLQRGPVLRASLARLSEREHTLLLSVHHIVADGWSVALVLRDLNPQMPANVLAGNVVVTVER